ncbi:MAG: T9SS type A sorting domain-containing protein [Bacteroidales bacterium]|nr:T9SS type A sorting domain-containing protein [Bacteroidales bacterium]
MKGKFGYIVAISIVLSNIQFLTAKAQIVDVDLSQEHQIIRGFGGIHINSWTGRQLNEDMQEKAFDNDPGEIGLTIFRLQIDPDSNRWNAELPAAQYAVNKGAIVFSSPWNPPAHMREVLRTTQYGTDYVLLPEYYDDYVIHLNKYIDYMNRNGVPLYAISVQNEPDWHGWTVWTAQEMLKFIKENAPGINSRVIAPESLGYVRTSIDPLLNDSVANSHIDILGTHLYGTPIANYYYPLVYEKGKEIWMTEHLFGSDSPELNTWSLALEMAEEINTSMDARMSAFVYWYIRRFYGLINDEGNITDKGYVLSQFSKFIRPGSFRVSTNFHPMANVSATAYKTDSSLVIIVVNNNSTPVNLDFNIQNNNIGVDSLTKFTSSESKKVQNEGTFKIESGSFSASVDAQSITTFTSHAAQGGKFGNLSPVASGGGEIEITDSLGTTHKLTLKGSESADPDGEVVKYSWSKEGLQVSMLPDIEVELGVGNHIYILTVTDNDGATDTDTVIIKVTSLNNTHVWLEAECTQVGANWDIHSSASCSNGKYLMVKPGVQATSAPSSNSADHLIYAFHLAESGSYKIWGRTMAPTANDDSYWVRVDNGEWTNWNGIVGGSTWQWDDVHNQSNDNPMAYVLDTGYHTLTVCFREDGAGIDKFYLTNTGQVPGAMGEEAFNCVTGTGNNSDITMNNKILDIFPNPVRSNFRVESNEPFNQLLIYDINGHKVMEKSYSTATLSDNIHLTIENGIYMLQVFNEKKSFIAKFIVSK